MFWPTRANLDTFDVSLSGPAFPNGKVSVKLTYLAVVIIAGVPFPATTWTQMEVNFRQPFQGDSSQFEIWMRTGNGQRRMTDEVLRIQNYVVDHLKAAAPYNENIRNIRHFGPAEWPYIAFFVGDQLISERANSALRAEVSCQPLNPETGTMAAGHELQPTIRSLLRACDLADCGYPTEALLLCAGLLDATVQKAVSAGMAKLGIPESSAEELLRNTTQRRLGTYLDPILKLVCGHSLREDDARLFEQITWLNRVRNDAIHNGKEVARSDARDACLVVFDTFDYLRTVSAAELLLPSRPTFVFV